MSDRTKTWLLDSDPAIRWQVLGDLLDEDPEMVARERQRVRLEGWGKALLDRQDTAGLWGGQLYSHKWLSTTYTMLLLRQMGLPPGDQQAHLACRALLEGGFQPGGGICYARTVSTIDNAVTGMILSLLAYFGYPDGRVHAILQYLLSQQQPEGSWEPEPGNQQLKYTTAATLQVLEGLHGYEKQNPERASIVCEAQQKGREFLLEHKLYQEKHTSRVIDPKMTLFSFPPRWFYDVLAALDYFQACQVERDARLLDAVTLLKGKQARDGTWTLQNRHPGKTYFEMEVVGEPSRWNTLRALRVLRWWEGV